MNQLIDIISEIFTWILVLFFGWLGWLIMYDWLTGNSELKSSNDALRELAYLQLKHGNGENDVFFVGKNKSRINPDDNFRYGGLDYLESATASWCPVCGSKMEGGPGGSRRHFCPDCGQMFDSNGNAVN